MLVLDDQWSVENKKGCETSFPVFGNRDIGALATIGDHGKTHGEKSSNKNSNLHRVFPLAWRWFMYVLAFQKERTPLQMNCLMKLT